MPVDTEQEDKSPAVFFDKDGTLVRNVPYNVRLERIELAVGAAEAVRRLKLAGFRLFVISNQSGVARGFFAEADLSAVWAKLTELCGVEFDGFYYCPHLPSGEIEKYRLACNCRKPAAGMILQAAREHNLDLARSWVVGDILNDVEAGRRAGCRTILLDVGSETESLEGEYRQPHFTAKNLTEAAEIILASD